MIYRAMRGSTYEDGHQKRGHLCQRKKRIGAESNPPPYFYPRGTGIIKNGAVVLL